MKVCIVVGTRPEIIKMSPIIRACEEQGLDYHLIHTGQHYSNNLDNVFFDDLKLPEPDNNLKVGSESPASQVGKIMLGIEEFLSNNDYGKNDVILVQGDTNSVLASGLAATKSSVKVGHVEAGLRSYDNEMPEELNRILIDHASDYLFAPTEESKRNLIKEGIEESKIYITGNTVVDAVQENRKIASAERILSKLDINDERYFILTLHRQGNVEEKSKLERILNGVKKAARKNDNVVLFLAHPRTKKSLEKFNIELDDTFRLAEPLGYLEFLILQDQANLIMTDSGGIQEEACIIGTPCVTLRENTERPETVNVGSNKLAGYKSNSIVECAEEMLSKPRGWNNPFGDGKSADRILSILNKQ